MKDLRARVCTIRACFVTRKGEGRCNTENTEDTERKTGFKREDAKGSKREWGQETSTRVRVSCLSHRIPSVLSVISVLNWSCRAAKLKRTTEWRVNTENTEDTEMMQGDKTCTRRRVSCLSHRIPSVLSVISVLNWSCRAANHTRIT
jgi:hypothetical protein